MKKCRAERVSVIIPAYNEAKRLGTTLREVYDFMRERFAWFEILVVDDGSKDRTAEVVAEFSTGKEEVDLIKLRKNSGKGYAVRTGMLAAEGDYVLFTDADHSTPIQEIEKALDVVSRDCDVAIGSRALPDSDVQVHQNFLRETMGKTFNLFVRMLAGLPFRDTQCGFKCYTRKAAQAIFSRAVVNGFAFDVETLVLAKKFGFRAKDFPVRWINSPDSRVRIFSSPIQMLWEVVKIRMNVLRGRYD